MATSVAYFRGLANVRKIALNFSHLNSFPRSFLVVSVAAAPATSIPEVTLMPVSSSISFPFLSANTAAFGSRRARRIWEDARNGDQAQRWPGTRPSSSRFSFLLVSSFLFWFLSFLFPFLLVSALGLPPSFKPRRLPGRQSEGETSWGETGHCGEGGINKREAMSFSLIYYYFRF